MILKVCSFFFLILMLSAFDSFAGVGCSTGTKSESPTKYTKIRCTKCHLEHNTLNCPEVSRQKELKLNKRLSDQIKEQDQINKDLQDQLNKIKKILSSFRNQQH